MNYSEEEQELLELTRLSLEAMGKKRTKRPAPPEIGEEKLGYLLDCAARHAVLPFYYDLFEHRLEGELWEKIEKSARRTVQQSYHLLELTHQAVSSLERAGVGVVVLKGIAAASVYPTPELRKSGDIDLLLLHPKDREEAGRVLQEIGYSPEGTQTAEHHVAYTGDAGVELELHTMLAEPFDNKRINRYLNSCLKNIDEEVVRVECMGYKFPVLSDGFFAFELLLHMLQHFLRAGFGLKLLCDWVLFWKRSVSRRQIRSYEHLIRGAKIEEFSDMVTSACVRELGLPVNCGLLDLSDGQTRIRSRESVTSFLKEIMEAEEFGQAKGRMVVMRTPGIKGYIREFHHQMNLNYPRAGRIPLFWPALWIATLVRFLRNNKRVRGGIFARDVLKKANDRSRVMEDIRLFRSRR